MNKYKQLIKNIIKYTLIILKILAYIAILLISLSVIILVILLIISDNIYIAFYTKLALIVFMSGVIGYLINNIINNRYDEKD